MSRAFYKLLLFLILCGFTFGQVTSPIEAIGTVLPRFVSHTVNPYRAFNDLMKQSLPLVPYQLTSWGGIGRCWSCKLTNINGLQHQYPAKLDPFIWAVAQIPFLQKNDDAFVNKLFNLKFVGSGIVGVYQVGNFNTTWSTSTGGQFNLTRTNQSLFIYIYNTLPTNPVRNITVTLSTLGANPATYTTNFLNYLKPFNLLRTCYWQGQNLYSSGMSLQIWNNRTLSSSSTQISNSGVALEYILQLQRAANVTLWLCIPDTADANYITQMASLIGARRNKTKIMYVQYGNVFTVMNDFPDLKTNPVFTTFMQTYGSLYRASVLFTINYRDIQYYINAMGMRTSPPINFTYIDAIGFEPSFGILDIGDVWNATVQQIKDNLTHFMLAYEVTANKAFQIAKKNNTNLISYCGGPYIKTYQWAYIWRNQSNSSYAQNASLERSLANTLYSLNMNDTWVGEFYLQWLARLKSMGVKTLVFSRLVGGAFTLNIDIVPLLPFLNMTTPAYKAIREYVLNGRRTTLPTSGRVPTNPFVCSAGCVWGDCIKNVCVCYAGYSGANCTTYTAPVNQDKIGTNLQGISYWNTQNPFIDMHKAGSDWVIFLINGGWGSGESYRSQISFDSNGYPTSLPTGITVGTLMARDIKTHYDPGNYTILYDGDGVLNFGLFDVKKIIYGVGKVVVTVDPSTNFNNGLLVVIQRTNPNNYIRNIRVIRPGFTDVWWALRFSPLVLQKLAPYKTLRFMDWTNTNAQTDQNWTDRVQTTHRTYTKNGVSWEDTIYLSNLLGKDAWINIPHLATSDYIYQLANLFLNKLEPHLKVYVEYSNQVWGTLFPGGQYAQAQGITYYRNNITDPTQCRFCWLSLITKNISDIWRSVWSTPTNTARLKIVVSTQAVNADTTKRILACENLYSKVNIVAIAPYLSVPLNDNMTSATLFSALNNQLINLNNLLKTHTNITNNYSLPLSCYESGQGLGGTSSITTTLQIGVQTDSRMTPLYQNYFNILFNNSIVLANHYTDTSHFSQYGSWGMFQYADERMSSSAKWNGTKNYLASRNLTLFQSRYGSCSLNCSGNGICSFGRCVCYNDYTGPTCSVGKFIDYVQCGYYCTFNQGVCVLNKIEGINRYFSCVCNTGYIGAECAIPVCESNCNYAGKCVGPNNCSCFRGRMGLNCQIDCGCDGHGTCNTNGTCLCDSGFIYNTTSRKCQFSCFNQSSISCYGPSLRSCSAGCVWGTCNNGTCVCWPGYTGTNCSTEGPVSYINNNLGINLGGLSYWSTQHLFKDYFKQSSRWIPQYYPGYFNASIAYTWNTSENFPVRPDGYPSSLNLNQSVAKLLLRDINLKYPSINQTNQYILLYDGFGVIQLGFDAVAYEFSQGRIRFRVNPTTVRDNGVYVQLLKTNPSNPVRNIRVILARDQYNYANDLVTQNFMIFLNQFSTIRSMDLLATNGSPVREWNQTTRGDQDTQAMPSGISIQLLAKLIKRTGRNLWLNVPHLATDNYVTNLAQYLKANLPNRTVIYLQYSNQVWNTFFEQGKYAQTQAAALNLSNYHKFYGIRSLEIFNIFESVFGVVSPRLKFVISFQAVSQWVADQILTGTNLIGKVNIIAGGPYYDCDSIGNITNTALYATLTPADIINKCNNSFSTLDSVLTIQKNIGTTYNLSIATYQSGTSISEQQTIYNGNDNPAATINFIAANRAAGMYDVYKKLLYKYKTNGFTVNAPLMLFSSIGTPSKYGSWGLLDYLDQVAENPTHPKFKAVIDFNLGL